MTFPRLKQVRFFLVNPEKTHSEIISDLSSKGLVFFNYGSDYRETAPSVIEIRGTARVLEIGDVCEIPADFEDPLIPGEDSTIVALEDINDGLYVVFVDMEGGIGAKKWRHTLYRPPGAHVIGDYKKDEVITHYKLF